MNPPTFPLGDLVFHPPVIAHRGARWRAPENTLAAFAAACEEGATWVETDIKLTQDGVPILMHDDTLERTTNGKGAVAEKTWDEIKRLRTKDGNEPIPRLIDALHFAIARYMHINLEIKPCPARTQATTMVTMIEVAKTWPSDHPAPLISSFDIEALTLASRLYPDWPRGLLLDAWQEGWPELVKLTQASTINIDAELLTQPRIETLKESGLPILAYTVNDKIRAKQLLQWGVTAVFSDTPGEIIKFL